MVNYDKMDRNQVREREFQVLDSGMAPALGKLSWWEEKSVKETLLCGGKGDFADVIVKDLEMGRGSWITSWAQCNHKQKKEAETDVKMQVLCFWP